VAATFIAPPESEYTMSHSRDKGKHESKKKPAHTLMEKRKMKHDKKGHHPAEVVEKLIERDREMASAKHG